MISIKNREKSEWVSFIAIFSVLTLHLAVVRYPIIFPDSHRYLNAAISLETNSYAPTLVCYLIRPLVILMGAWGFAIFQIAILTYVLMSALKFFNKNSTIGIISIIMSAAGFLAIMVMMDIYTAIGLLALFLILNGKRDIILYIILGISFTAHYGNIFLFPICTLVYWVIFNRKSFSVLRLLSIIFITPLIMASLVNYCLDGDSRFLSKAKYSVIAASIMIDSPEITRAYMEKRPDSQLTNHRQEYEAIILHKRRVGSLLWGNGQGLYRKFGGSIKFNPEAKEFIVYALKNHPGILLKKSIYNIYEFLKRPHYNLSAIVSELFYEVCYYLSLLVILVFSVLSISFPKLRKTGHFSFVVFVIMVLFFNALIMPFSCIMGRYQVRIMLLPCLAMCLIISEFLHKIRTACPIF